MKRKKTTGFATLDLFFNLQLAHPSIEGFAKQVRYIGRRIPPVSDDNDSALLWEKLFLSVASFFEKNRKNPRISKEKWQTMFVLEEEIEQQALKAWQYQNRRLLYR